MLCISVIRNFKEIYLYHRHLKLSTYNPKSSLSLNRYATLLEDSASQTEVFGLKLYYFSTMTIE